MPRCLKEASLFGSATGPFKSIPRSAWLRCWRSSPYSRHPAKLVPAFILYWLQLFDPIDQLIAIVARLSDIDSDDDAVGRVGGDLHVVAGRKSAIRLFHHPGVRIRLADWNLILFRIRPRLLYLFQFFERVFPSFLL